MVVEFDVHFVDGLSVAEDKNAGISPEMIAGYISAGILFPDEVRQAERLLRRLNNAA